MNKIRRNAADLMVSILCFWLVLACWQGGSSVRAQDDLPEPREPDVKPVTRVEEFLPGLRKYIESAEPKRGEVALVVTGQSTSPLINEGVIRLLKEKGVTFNLVMIPDFEGMTNCGELQEKLWIDGTNGGWWPPWVWKLIEEIKPHIVYQLTMMAQNHNWRDGIPVYRWFQRQGIRSRALASSVGHPTWYPVGGPETLSYEPYYNFPVPLWEAIRDRTNAPLPKSGWALAEVTDPNGTNFTVEINYDPQVPGQPAREGFRNARGIIVSATSHSCEFPRMEMTFKDNRLAEIKAGGSFGEWMKQRFLNQYKDVDFGYHGGPGNNFFEEFVIAYHPKVFPYLNGYTGTMRSVAMQWKVFRSGVLHVAIGSGGAILNADKSIKVKKQHVDFELFFPTITIAGKTLIRHGHLLTLDDPEIRKIAAKYGNPDELLQEAWIPKRRPDGEVDWDAQSITRGPR
ncbi:MAG: hypothetical protein HYX74_03290 [Acidobacteria bacterium]|nr:hypothetical protein [Acidobacteriota bacterium]